MPFRFVICLGLCAILSVNAASRTMHPSTGVDSVDSSVPQTQTRILTPEPRLVIPTIAASVVATNSEQTLYGGEVGIIYGRRDRGHGFYGVSGYRFCIDVAAGPETTVIGINGGVVLENFFVLRLRGGIYHDLGKNTTLMFLPEAGFSHNGIVCLTLGGMLPLLGSNALEPSARLNLTWNMFEHD